MDGYIHSIQSFSTLDGPGIRSVVFLYGCPLRCVYCHNPDTWKNKDSKPVSAKELTDKIHRFIPYIKYGGVTFSGGEPLLQAEFVKQCAELLHQDNINVAIDTCGAVYNDAVNRLLDEIDFALLDIKFTSNEDYKRYAQGSLDDTFAFMEELEKRKIKTWIRHVVVPGINDTEDNVLKLAEIVKPFSVVEKVELLPFRKLCIEKYERLNIKFPLENTPELSEERLRELQALI